MFWIFDISEDKIKLTQKTKSGRIFVFLPFFPIKAAVKQRFACIFLRLSFTINSLSCPYQLLIISLYYKGVIRS